MFWQVTEASPGLAEDLFAGSRPLMYGQLTDNVGPDKLEQKAG